MAPRSSLLFLIHERSGARIALKRTSPTAAEPDGLWQAGREKFTTADLVVAGGGAGTIPGSAAPPVFQDFLWDIADRWRPGRGGVLRSRQFCTNAFWAEDGG